MPVSSETTKSGLQPKFPSLNKNADLYKSAFFIFLRNLESPEIFFRLAIFAVWAFFFLKRRVSMGSQRGGNPRRRYVRKKMDKNAECDNKIRKSAPQ